MNRKLIVSIVLILVASLLPDILFREWTGSIPVWLPFAKSAVLIFFVLLNAFDPNRHPQARFAIILLGFVLVNALMGRVESQPGWRALFDFEGFVGAFGSSVLLKSFGALVMILLLALLFQRLSAFYLIRGDLNVRAREMKPLRIPGGRIPWGRLSLVAAGLIGLGTLLLTMLTVTGFSLPIANVRFLRHLPFIVVLAGANAFAEGVMYRNAILGALRGVLPDEQKAWVAAILFGLAHYYGAPSGPVGVLMSGLLGWFMARSMLDTRGFVAPWIIHLVQDIVIFSLILVQFF